MVYYFIFVYGIFCSNNMKEEEKNNLISNGNLLCKTSFEVIF